MCITFWYTPTVPSSFSASTTSETPREKGNSPYAFILLSNRDLELGRPAFDASFHSFERIVPFPYGRSKAPPPPRTETMRNGDGDGDGGGGKGRRIISGRDAADAVGGTWLGLGAYSSSSQQKHARIGVLTNIHDDSPVPKGTRTRGCLIKDWLLRDAANDEHEEGDPEEGTKRYLDGLKDEAVKLAGFNLLLFDIALDAQPGTETGTETESTHVRRVSAHQLTNRYRPYQSPTDAQAIPADESSINTSHTTRTLPISPNPSHASTSPLGIFRSAITDLRPTALRLGGMSNSLMEEPFEKVLEGTRGFEEIVGREFTKAQGWDEGREEELLERLFGLMSETHPVERFQDLERAICVPLCGIPLPGMTGTLYEPPHEHPSPGPSQRSTHVPRIGAVHAGTLLGTPMRTPEGSPDRGSSRSLPTLNEDEAQNSSPNPSYSRPVTPCTLTHGHKAKPYGTRLTTIILVKWNGEVTYVERDIWWMDEMGSVHKGGTEDRVFRFRL